VSRAESMDDCPSMVEFRWMDGYLSTADFPTTDCCQTTAGCPRMGDFQSRAGCQWKDGCRRMVD